MKNAFLMKLNIICSVLSNSSRGMLPRTGDLDVGILIALILISVFVAFIVIKNSRRR